MSLSHIPTITLLMLLPRYWAQQYSPNDTFVCLTCRFWPYYLSCSNRFKLCPWRVLKPNVDSIELMHLSPDKPVVVMSRCKSRSYERSPAFQHPAYILSTNWSQVPLSHACHALSCANNCPFQVIRKDRWQTHFWSVLTDKIMTLSSADNQLITLSLISL